MGNYKCGNCVFYASDKRRCHRHPPSKSNSDIEVHANHWCGHHPGIATDQMGSIGAVFSENWNEKRDEKLEKDMSDLMEKFTNALSPQSQPNKEMTNHRRITCIIADTTEFLLEGGFIVSSDLESIKSEMRKICFNVMNTIE